MTDGYFITGTDTDVGKTVAATALVRALVDSGYRTGVFKPISAGCEVTPDGLRNDDAERLAHESNIDLPYEWINPFAFEPPIAPHIAAEEAGTSMSIDQCLTCLQQISAHADLVIAEGAGGWLVPLDAQNTLGDLAAALSLPVILVVGVRLGCISHALLTVQSIRASGLPLAGWIANRVDPGADRADENIASIQARIPAPLLGILPYDDQMSVKARASCIDITTLNR